MAVYSDGPKTIISHGDEGASQTPDIEIAMRELEKELEVLAENIGGLMARLDPVMEPNEPKIKGGVDAVPQPPHSALYNRLQDFRGKVVSANYLISATKDRLEV